MNNSELRELGKTLTYTEIAEIDGREPMAMRKYLSRHGIGYVIKKNNKPKESNGVVKSRFRSRRTLEYWLSVKSESGGFLYHGWYTLTEIAGDHNNDRLVKECSIDGASLRARIRTVIKGTSQYKTLWDAIKAPSKYAKIEEVEVDHLWEALTNLMKAGSVAHTVR